MSSFALVIVLAAAVLHASWNALVKAAGAERSLVMAMVAGAHVLSGGIALLFVETPAWAAWPFIIASALLHYFYYAFLFLSYRYGDLSQVYPIARGVAPMLVAIGALVFAGEQPGPAGWAGVVIVSLGIATLSLRNGVARASRQAVLSALMTGAIIAAYTVTDGMGIRRSEAIPGYIAWIFFLEIPITVGILWRRGQPLSQLPRRSVIFGLAGGLLSVGAYALVLYAKTIAPLGAVSAVRESSVIIAALIGVVLFHERPWKHRVLAAVTVAAGVIVLATAA